MNLTIKTKALLQSWVVYKSRINNKKFVQDYKMYPNNSLNAQNYTKKKMWMFNK